MVIIKNMRMPKNCIECKFCGFGGKACRDRICMLTSQTASNPGINEKMSRCPLVSVPESTSRLIDADALLDRFEKEAKAADEHGREFSTCFMHGSEPSAEWWAVSCIVEDFIAVSEAQNK